MPSNPTAVLAAVAVVVTAAASVLVLGTSAPVHTTVATGELWSDPSPVHITRASGSHVAEPSGSAVTAAPVAPPPAPSTPAVVEPVPVIEQPAVLSSTVPDTTDVATGDETVGVPAEGEEVVDGLADADPALLPTEPVVILPRFVMRFSTVAPPESEAGDEVSAGALPDAEVPVEDAQG